MFCASGFHIFLGLLSVCVGVILSIQAEVWLAHSVSPIWSGGIVSKDQIPFRLKSVNYGRRNLIVVFFFFSFSAVFHNRTCWSSLCQKKNVICGTLIVLKGLTRVFK